jgi:hypothetical protein
MKWFVEERQKGEIIKNGDFQKKALELKTMLLMDPTLNEF